MVENDETDVCDGDPFRLMEREAQIYLETLAAVRKCISDLHEGRAKDPHVIMSVLPHLHMENGWKLAVMTKGDNCFGFSKFYAFRVQHQNALTKSWEVCKRLFWKGGDVEKDELEQSGMEWETNLFNRVHLDGSKESYWEAVLLMFASTQYRLFWHANYMKKRIVTSLETFWDELGQMTEVKEGEVRKLLEEWSGSERSSQRRGVCNRLLLPKVILEDENAGVSFAYFTPFGGLCLVQIRCQGNPFKIIDTCSSGGFYYHCGITY